jgi:hypothetical protein
MRLAGPLAGMNPIKKMATSVKSKFVGLLRGLLRQLDDPKPEPTATAAVPPTRTTTPVSNQTNPTEKNSPATRPGTPVGVELPLAPVIAALPMDLRAKIAPIPVAGLMICLPTETVMSQLAFGAVKITFGELRQLAPAPFANYGAEYDSRSISLPLNEILARINPALLARRTAEKVEVTEEISGPFGGRGKGITFTTQPLKEAPVAPATPAPEPEPIPVRAPINPPVPAATFIPPARPVTPPTLPVTFPPRQTAPTAFTPPPKSANGNGNGHSNGHTNGNGHTPPPPGIKFMAAPVPTPAPPAARPEPAPPTTSGPDMVVALADLAEKWPEELRNEIVRLNLAGATVALAVAAVEPGLKRGRVTMTWKQLRRLARAGSAASPNDGLELDLPLRVLAPAFLEAQKNLAGGSRKVVVSAEIPNLFFGFPQPAAAPAVPAAPTGRVLDTNFYGQATESETELRRVENPATDFLSRQAHPKDVVARAAALPGVAGAVVALPDGLRVASQVPADLNADTLAAFLPQIYDRLNQSTRELRMGALNNVNFTVGNIPWKIFRIRSVYFAVFGRAGESLPAAQVAGLAAELDRKKSS